MPISDPLLCRIDHVNLK